VFNEELKALSQKKRKKRKCLRLSLKKKEKKENDVVASLIIQ